MIVNWNGVAGNSDSEVGPFAETAWAALSLEWTGCCCADAIAGDREHD
jgi:hypothetical protein